jgi:hypothetical protein
MTTAKKAGISLADLDARSTSEVPFEFEYILPNGEGSGVTFKVLGSQSPTVVAEVNKLLDARRRKEAGGRDHRTVVSQSRRVHADLGGSLIFQPACDRGAPGKAGMASNEHLFERRAAAPPREVQHSG